MPEPISVLVVDDSAFMRKMVTEVLSQDDALRVVGQARDGADALSKLETLRPDVITLDVEMPVMDGFSALQEILKRRPTPVVMLSSLAQAGAEATLRCLDLGAVDFVGKPSGAISLDIARVGDELRGKVKIAARAKVGKQDSPSPPAPLPRWGRGEPVTKAPPASHLPSSLPLRGAGVGNTTVPPLPPAKPEDRERGAGGVRTAGLLFIGASTGGPRALQELVPALPGDLDVPVVIVQHMPPGFTASLARRLDAESALTVREAQAGDLLQPGVVLIAPGGYHLEFDGRGQAHLTDSPPVHGVRPAVDVTIASLARSFGTRMVAVLLTGMGRDGARGLKIVRDLGGETIAEDASTCVVYGMPKAALEIGGVCRSLPLPRIAGAAAQAIRSARTGK